MIPTISDEFEKDVQFICDKFGLNKTSFRLLMNYPIISEKVHKLTYEEVQAEDLYMIFVQALHSYKPPQVPRKTLVNCIGRLQRIMDDEGGEGFNGRTASPP